MQQKPGHIFETRKKQQAIINFCIMTSHIYNIMCAATVVIRGYRFLIAIWGSVIIYFLGKSFICIKMKKIGNHSSIVKNSNPFLRVFMFVCENENIALACIMVFLCPLKSNATFLGTMNSVIFIQSTFCFIYGPQKQLNCMFYRPCFLSHHFFFFIYKTL